MELSYANLKPHMSAEAQAAPKVDCIEALLKHIEAEISESLNSAENLADKLKRTEKTKAAENMPGPSDTCGRLAQILNTIRFVNQELNRAHSAISG